MEKDTSKLLEELKSFEDFKSFMRENGKQVAETSLSDYILELMAKKRLDRSFIIKRSEMDETYAYQIISGIRKAPARNKVLALAFGMELDFEETQQMLKKTGYAPLYAKKPFDCIVIYALCKRLGVLELNEMLFDYLGETL